MSPRQRPGERVARAYENLKREITHSRQRLESGSAVAKNDFSRARDHVYFGVPAARVALGLFLWLSRSSLCSLRCCSG